MAKVHPSEVVRQRVLVDLQIHPCESPQVIEEYLEFLYTHKGEPIPESIMHEMNEVAKNEITANLRKTISQQSQYKHVNLNRYASMARVHPMNVVRQRVTVDLKLSLSESNPAVEEYLEFLYSRKDAPTPESMRKAMRNIAMESFSRIRNEVQIPSQGVAFSRYESMGKVHSPEVIEQRILTDLQMHPSESPLAIREYVDFLCSHKGQETSNAMKNIINQVAYDHSVRRIRRATTQQGIDFKRYVSMSKVHSMEIVRQAVLVDLQIPEVQCPESVNDFLRFLYENNNSDTVPEKIKKTINSLAMDKYLRAVSPAPSKHANIVELSRYESMSHVHTMDVVKQRLLTDLQLLSSEAPSVIEEYLEFLFSHKNEKVPIRIQTLLNEIAYDSDIRTSRRAITLQGLNFTRYEKMANIHPPEIVLQRLCTDLQIKSTQVPSVVEDYLQYIFANAEFISEIEKQEKSE